MKIRQPNEIRLFTEENEGVILPVSREMRLGDVTVSSEITGGRLSLAVTSSETPLYYLRLRWNFTNEERRREPVRIMGDTWERSYGELEWRGTVPQRFMPWYCLVSNGTDSVRDCRGRFTECFGVEVRPGAVCAWQYDTMGVTLWADVRCGSEGVLLCGRKLEVCTVVMSEYRDISAYESGRAFCREMCRDPLLPSDKVYGSNNWYYAVGKSSHAQILRDAELVSRLSENMDNRPYMVIDDGWQRNPCDGPWDSGNERFPDMARLARDITDRGAVPGIWVRYLSCRTGSDTEDPSLFQLDAPGIFDPSLPEVICRIKADTKRLVGWGYRLIKHDFTVFDIFGGYGSEMNTRMVRGQRRFRDRSRTTAEITVSLYEAIREAAGDDTVIIACNTPSHLTAGTAHLMRIGYDTSGRFWERTRDCGVNSLAFRMMQNGTFYVCDADCCSHTGAIDWCLNRAWLEALSESGTALFISTDPDATGADQERDMKAALLKSSLQADEMIPLDWMENTAPERYLVNGEEKHYSWYDETGTHKFIPPTVDGDY